VHNRIYCDSKTKEILILSWYKYNWTKSPKIISIISREKADIESKKIISLIDERLSILFNSKEEKDNEKEIEEEKNDDTLSIGYRYPTNTNSISNSNSNSISILFDYWNEKKIISHREISKDIVEALSKALSKYTEEQIKECIDRYAKVLNDKHYFWHYKWSLKDFLNRKDGISSFTDEGSKWNSYQDFLKRPNPKAPELCDSTFDADDFFNAALERTERVYQKEREERAEK
jgi:hypothetical protein